MKEKTALNLAIYITNRFLKEDDPIVNLKLQKLLYFIQKHFLKRDSIKK